MPRTVVAELVSAPNRAYGENAGEHKVRPYEGV